VVFTDGRDTARRVDVPTVQSAVSASPDTLMVVGLQGADWRPDAIAALGARYTVEAPDAGQLPREFSAVANRIAGQASRSYLVGYCSPSRAGSHTVAVNVSGTQTRAQAVYDFDAGGFDGSCRAAAFEAICEGRTCGGLGCGACDDRTDSCRWDGVSHRCYSFCELYGDCSEVPFVSPLGYELTCERDGHAQCSPRRAWPYETRECCAGDICTTEITVTDHGTAASGEGGFIAAIVGETFCIRYCDATRGLLWDRDWASVCGEECPGPVNIRVDDTDCLQCMVRFEAMCIRPCQDNFGEICLFPTADTGILSQGSGCIDVMSDTRNCGGCDVRCDPRGETCEAGACAL